MDNIELLEYLAEKIQDKVDRLCVANGFDCPTDGGQVLEWLEEGIDEFSGG